MKKLFIYPMTLCHILTFSGIAMQENISKTLDDLNYLRPKKSLNIFSSKNSYPQPTSLEDGIQLCQSLAQSTMESCKGIQNDMVRENPKLIKLAFTVKNPLAPNALQIRFSLLNDPNNSGLEDLLAIYVSYNTIVKKCEDIFDILKNQNDKQQIISSLKKQEELTKKYINYFKKIINKDSEPDKLNYDLCDIKESNTTIVYMIMKILEITPDSIDPSKIEETKKQKKKKNKKRLTQNNSSKAQPINVDSLNIAPTISSKKGEINNKTENEKKEKVETTPIISQESKSLLSTSKEFKKQEIIKEEPPLKKESTLPSPVSEVSEVVGEPLSNEPNPLNNLKPWEEFERKKKINPTQNKPLKKPEDKKPSPSFVLDIDHSPIARSLLGLGIKETVPLASYKKLVEALPDGAVIDQSLNIHFIARHLITHRWCSVKMHRLHGDDFKNIPQGTRFWNTAKQLLINIGLTEEHLTPL